MLKVLDLFSGIGGFSLGLERTGGFETVAFCEIEKFPQQVLAKHWPNIPIYEDVRNVTRERLNADGIFPDVITGGFPCQDISVAGKQAGIGEGTRSGLWSECARILGEFRPRYAIFENVTALLSGNDGKWFERVLWDISQVGYDAEWHCIPASELGAHHHRDRVWIIAYPRRERFLQRSPQAIRPTQQTPDGQEFDQVCPDVADTGGRAGEAKLFGRFQQILRKEDKGRETGRSGIGNVPIGRQWAVEPSVRGVVDGVSDGAYQGRVVTGVKNRAHRLKALGNAVVPQIPELIGRAILYK